MYNTNSSFNLILSRHYVKNTLSLPSSTIMSTCSRFLLVVYDKSKFIYCPIVMNAHILLFNYRMQKNAGHSWCIHCLRLLHQMQGNLSSVKLIAQPLITVCLSYLYFSSFLIVQSRVESPVDFMAMFVYSF